MSHLHRRRPLGTRRLKGAARALGVLVLLSAVLTAGAPDIIKIKSGDSLWALAQRHHTSVPALQQLNRMGERTTIYIGQLLRVPGNATPAPRAVTRTHLVSSGETLSGIARQYGVSVAVLKRQNSLRGDLVRIGSRLKVTTRAKPVQTSRGPGRPSQATNAGVPISGAMGSSVAAHRATLAARPQPSQAGVRRLIASTARRYGVDRSFALAVAYNESGFQQRVVSPVDAIGVMQVLPSTGRLLGLAYGRRFDLLDTRDNITAGVLLLRQLRSSTGTDGMALAGYYQGLGSVHAQGLLPQTHAYIRTVSALRGRFARG